MALTRFKIMHTPMPLNKEVLFNLLKNFDEEAKEKITLVAVGGTAVTLLDLKVINFRY
jgi:hypothetical protein